MTLSLCRNSPSPLFFSPCSGVGVGLIALTYAPCRVWNMRYEMGAMMYPSGLICFPLVAFHLLRGCVRESGGKGGGGDANRCGRLATIARACTNTDIHAQTRNDHLCFYVVCRLITKMGVNVNPHVHPEPEEYTDGIQVC
jgi:hypothetical protein